MPIPAIHGETDPGRQIDALRQQFHLISCLAKGGPGLRSNGQPIGRLAAIALEADAALVAIAAWQAENV